MAFVEFSIEWLLYEKMHKIFNLKISTYLKTGNFYIVLEKLGPARDMIHIMCINISVCMAYVPTRC